MASKRAFWLCWGILTVVAATYLGFGLFTKDAGHHTALAGARSQFLPGKTTSGHHQIEMACESCHTSAFATRDDLQEACVKCHGAELKAADDKHPKSKFTDPRNAERAAKLDATYCVTCHVEHRPDTTHAMGVTLPQDFCSHCHGGEFAIANDRPSHAGMAFDTCASSGCHRFHDNRALYEDFLLKHAKEPSLLPKTTLPRRDFSEAVKELTNYPADKYPFKPLGAEDNDAPKSTKVSPALMDDWLSTAHAKAGVNCSACHQSQGAAWIERPGQQQCKLCHTPEVDGWLAGKHGMRVAEKLPPMAPKDARLPMREDALTKQLTCNACHAAHRFDTRKAAVEGCLACHADPHSLAYKKSPHFDLWRKELTGELPPGSGVSCASCHLPRVEHRTDDIRHWLVQHNQNDTLRPNEKMIRPVCLSCHGLEFSIDALADPRLIANNFAGPPGVHIKSLEMAEKRKKEQPEKKRKRPDAESVFNSTHERSPK
ncbi:MAG: cytochrome c3 family protein [Burkholderiales bacterium]